MKFLFSIVYTIYAHQLLIIKNRFRYISIRIFLFFYLKYNFKRDLMLVQYSMCQKRK